MKNIVIAIFIAAFIVSAVNVNAEEKKAEPKDKFCVIEHTPQATEPVGAVIETVGVFVGKIASATEIAFTGERKITIENETGECKIFPFCATTKVVDQTFHAATFDQLKQGECVKVKYEKEAGVEKAKEVIIQK